jgi:hypothetical protein
MKVEIEATPSPGEEKKKEYGKWDKWEIESCADCLIRAEEIKADKEKMAYVKPFLEKKVQGANKAIKSIADIKGKLASMEAEYEEED